MRGTPLEPAVFVSRDKLYKYVSLNEPSHTYKKYQIPTLLQGNLRIVLQYNRTC
jgi:hypothetical protein